ncbi:hypothetical protein LZF95_08305 [Algoriphagus sp. AGSA1]|uniref:hypothetical protein n=1 Tax=Algoriphagus sp. AGSA1 TaxID=2907213 RepID=UPI001F348988|nr:hypothetical protein [Algoriphagus sp. AGSA1]MCE7054671.1 hypothetical protein [Algoriphagus sp. AGSA1]
MSNKKESNFEKKIDKDNIKVTPFGTNKKKKNVPDESPQEEYLTTKSGKEQKED